jgi:predicted phosphodiesterase
MRILSIALLMLGFGGSAIAAPEPPMHSDAHVDNAPWTHLEFHNDSEAFQFAIVSDNAGGPRQGIFKEAMGKLNLLQPEFVIGLGDYIEGYEDTKPLLEAQWDRFMTDLSGLEPPFFFVPGNHDVGRPLWWEVYTERFGAAFYHFVYKNVLFLCLSTNDTAEKSTGISDEQVKYVEQTLGEHTEVRWTIVLQHKPLWNEEGHPQWEAIEALLKKRKTTVFSGHTHNYLHQQEDGITFITLATTGGGSMVRGPELGEFDEVAWITMTEEGPQIANLMLDGILDRNLRTPESARALADFKRGRAVTAAPVLVDGPDFSSGETSLRVKNPLDRPMRIKVLQETATGLRMEPASIHAMIPGGESLETVLRISAAEALPVSAVQPILLHWTASYDNDANKAVTEVSGTCRVPIDTAFPLSSSDVAVIVDGKLDEWEDLPFRVDQPADIFFNPAAWKGPWDSAFRFATRCDENSLYVALKVVDDEPCFEGWKYWEDFAMLWVDGRASEKDDPKTSVFNVITGPAFTDEQASEYLEGVMPDGVQRASVATEDGFEAEFSIPLAYLNERQQGAWNRVRLNVSVRDFDQRDERDGVTILCWRPQWFRGNDYPQSGLFLRSLP